MKVVLAVSFLTTAAVALQSPRPRSSSLKAATSLNPVVAGINGNAQQTTWDCDEDVNCVEVPACDDKVCRTSLDVRIHNTWYDLSGT
jgi:hypothetical protein